MAQNDELLAEQLKRQGLPLRVEVEAMAHARRADFIAALAAAAVERLRRRLRTLARGSEAGRLRRA